MAQAQVLHRQRSYNDSCYLRQNLSQPQTSLHHSPQAAGASDQSGNLINGNTMAQAMLQCQYRPESHPPFQTWPFQQLVSREQMPPVASSPELTTNSGTSSQNQFWGGTSVFDNNDTWAGVLPMKSLIVSGPDYHYLRNNDLSYDPVAAQNAVGKGDNAYSLHPYWPTYEPNAVPRGVSVNGSDLETNNSLSPNSYLDEKLESESFSPGSNPDQGSLRCNWNGYPTSFPAMEDSSPKSASSGHHLVSMSTKADEEFHEVDFSGLPQIGLGTTMPSMELVGSSYQNDGLTGSLDDSHHTSSEYSYTHGSSPDASPWYLPGFSHNLSGLPSKERDPYVKRDRSNNLSSVSPSQAHSYTPHPKALWSDSRIGIPAQTMLQDRFEVPRSADTQTQRKLNDDILIQGKKEGLTYKEIRRKMVGEKPAESTLRGRYRSLTKARKDRVRKPVWMKRDIELLNDSVEQELDRIEGILVHPQALSFDQKLLKVQWKKVADYIDDRGGSYHFGNSTCKRKWLEVHRSS